MHSGNMCLQAPMGDGIMFFASSQRLPCEPKRPLRVAALEQEKEFRTMALFCANGVRHDALAGGASHQ